MREVVIMRGDAVTAGKGIMLNLSSSKRQEISEASKEDLALMLRLKRGDDAAFEELVNKHKKRVLNTIYRFIGKRDDAEDLAQDVFIALYRAAPRYEPRAKFTTYLYRIIANRCFNYSRREKLARFLSLEELPFLRRGGKLLPREPADTRPDPEAESGGKELAAEMAAALALLPERQRLAVVMRYYSDLSYEEISQSLGIRLPAVKSLLHRGVVSLRAKLKGRLLRE